MDFEHSDRLVIVNLPIDCGDLEQIQDLIRSQRPFCTSFPDEDVYSAFLYHRESSLHDTQAFMLWDQNVFSRIVGLARGGKASPEHRLPAAIMAFAQCTGIQIEPSLALSEGIATRQYSDKAASDLSYFRAADSLHAQEFVDIALGRATELRTKLEMGAAPLDVERMSVRLKHYGRVYAPVLKMGLIELGGGPQETRMRKFLDWMYVHWYFSAPATLFAGMCFSGLRPPRIMKGLRSRDRGLALKGLRNDTWDLAYVGWWGELIKQQACERKLWILCSLDKALREVANHLLVRAEHAPDEALRQYLVESFGDRAGVELCQYYETLVSTKDDPARKVNQLDGSQHREYGKRVEAALEAEILIGL